jgi:hypothetical protein
MRYARGEAILRVIAMRYAPQLIVSQNELILLANSEAPKCRLTHDPSEGPEAWSTPAEISAL